MAETIVLDPTSEDATNSPLTLAVTGAGSIRVVSHSYPQPAQDVTFSGSADSEGDQRVSARYRNREISVTLELLETTHALLRTSLASLLAKLTKLQREGGTFQRTMETGEVVVFDVLTVQGTNPSFDLTYYLGKVTQIEVTFICKPLGRGAEQTVSAQAETTNPVNVYTVSNVLGDVEAIGRLTVTDTQAQDQFFVMWGAQSKNRDTSANAALFYEAEGRTALGGASSTARSGASGGNVLRHSNLTPVYQAIMSTQATGGGAHLQHIGRFQVWARVFDSNATIGNVDLVFEWAQGDFIRRVQNPAVSAPVIGHFALINFGQIELEKVATGTQRWEGRILARSSVVGDDIDIDCLFFMPVDDGYGEAAGNLTYQSISTFSARDEFDQTAGALTGKTAAVGGAWGGAGDADDFAVNATTKTAERSAAGDTTLGRYVVTTANLTNTIVQTNFSVAPINSALSASIGWGVLARYTNTSNTVVAKVENALGSVSGWRLIVLKYVGGVASELLTLAISPLSPNTTYTLRYQVDAGGRWAVWLFPTAAVAGSPTWSGQDDAMRTGGTLASGVTGIYHINTSATNVTVSFDNYAAGVPTNDAAVYASRALQVRHDRVIRQDSAGAVYSRVSRYEGDHLLVQPAGAEGRSTRFAVKASRNDPYFMGDIAIDDLTVQLHYTPRWLVVPGS